MESSNYSEFCALFALAEEKIKQIEILKDELIIPSINELRYAGYHCACSINKDIDQKMRDEHIASAIKHCKRAIYDALEIGITHYLLEIHNFQNDYKLVIKSKNYKGLHRMFTKSSRCPAVYYKT